MISSTPLSASSSSAAASVSEEKCERCGSKKDMVDEAGQHVHSQRNRKVNLPPKVPLPCCCFYVAPHIRCTKGIHTKLERQGFADLGKRVGNERMKRSAKVGKSKEKPADLPKVFSRDASPELSKQDD